MNRQKSEKNPILQRLPEDTVKLRPLLGISPLIYVPFLFLVLLFLVLFFIIQYLFHPSVSRVHVKSIPHTAAVYVDDKYLGATPLKANIENSNHTIRIEKPGFEQEKTIQFKKRNVFANMFTKNITDTLILKDSVHILESTVSELASYVNTISTRKYIVPNVFANRIEEVLSLLEVTADSSYHQKNTKEELPTNNSQIKKGIEYEKLYLLMLELVYTSLPYLQNQKEYVATIRHILHDYPVLSTIRRKKNNLTSIVLDISIDEMLNKIELYVTHSIQDAFNNGKQQNNQNINIPINNPKVNVLKVMDNDFIYVPNGKLAYTLHSHLEFQNIYQTNTDAIDFQVLEFMPAIKNNNQSSISITTNPFYIQSKHVTVGQYVTFLRENTQWQVNSKKNISSEHKKHHLNMDNYLEFNTDAPVTHVSWYDAQAYVQWFNTLLEARDIPYQAKLANEFEWRFAQQYIADRNYDITLKKTIIETAIISLYDDIWEWTETWYSPLPQYNKQYIPFLGKEKIVLGGNYSDILQTHENLNSFLSRNNALSLNWTSEYTSFRLILIPLKASL